MVPYDAKSYQECKICGFLVSHNKQGRFTSHLKNEHTLDLNSYLKTTGMRTQNFILNLKSGKKRE